MRALACLLLSLAACAIDKPADVPRSTTTEETTPQARDAQKYIGFRSPDLLLEGPPSLRPRGERIIDGTDHHGLVVLGVEGGGELIFLDRRTDEGDFIVEAVLELPDVTHEQVAWDYCELDGKPDSRIVAVVAAGTQCDPANALVSSAWRANPEAARFDAISPDGVRCPAPTCDRTAGVPGGVVGGVPGH